MGKFDADRAAAAAMIAENGAEIAFSRLPPTDGSTATGAPLSGAGSELKFTRRAVVLPAQPTRADTFMSATMIRTKNRIFYAEAVVGGPFIQEGDLFWAEGYEWRVAGVDGIAPDGGDPIFQSGVASR